MSTYLVTGTSRGLGLALTQQILLLPPSQMSTIIATARSPTPSPALSDLITKHAPRLTYTPLDTSSVSSINSAVSAVEKTLNGKPLDVLINNAGIMSNFHPNGIQDMEVDDLDKVFHADVSSVHSVTKAFLPLMKQGQGGEKKVINISTALGSIAMADQFGFFSVPAYKISKTALNMLTVQYALRFASEGFVFVMVSPGWLQTDMGSGGADLPVEVGAKAVLDVILKADKSTNGKFCNVHVKGWENAEGPSKYDGKPLPW